MLRKIVFSLSFQLIIIMGFVFAAGPMIPLGVKSFFYACALTFKEGLVWTIPFVIFSYMFSCLVAFRSQAGKFLVCLVLGVCLSNATAALLSFGMSKLFLTNIGAMPLECFSPDVCLEPLWSFTLPTLISNKIALASAVLLSFLAPLAIDSARVDNGARFLKKGADTLLNKIFIPFLPLLVLGFVFKMQHEGALSHAFSIYGKVVILFTLTQIAYLLFLYSASSGFSIKKTLKTLQAVLPSGMAAFTTMSSLAALSFTLKGAQENTQNDPMVDAVVPATVNIHLIGDSIAVPLMALAILSSFSMPLPNFEVYLVFVFFFVMNKFAVAAVPGGGIIVMLPILEQYLGFNDQMLSLIMMLYILFDAISTTANVLGNGAFAIYFSKLFKKISPNKNTL